jgi:conjugal transfer pilus assembly protein TraD
MINKIKNILNKNKEEAEDFIEESKFDSHFNFKEGLYIGEGVNLINPERTESIYVPISDLAGHTSVFGTTRVGKTRLMMGIIRQLILLGWDIFIVDPKGSIGQEILGWVLEFAEEAKRLRDVKYISPMFPEYSLSFNPLYYLSNEEIASGIATLIDAKDEFYVNIGYEVVKCICLCLEYLEKASDPMLVRNAIEKEYERFVFSGDVVDVVNAIHNPDVSEQVSEPTSPENLNLSEPPLRTLVTLSDLATYSCKEGFESLKEKLDNKTEFAEPTPELMTLKMEALRALGEQLGKPADYFSKVASSYNLILSQLSSGAMGNILSTTKINPIYDMLYNKNRGNIFIIHPFPMKYKKASDAFVKVFFGMLTSLCGIIGATGRPIPRKVALMVDEGGSVLYKGVETLFNKAGGLGMRIFIFTQAFSDYIAEVGKEISDIISDNTNIKIFLRMNDNSSRELVSSSFGTIKKSDTQIGGSKTDVRGTVSTKEEELLVSSHVSALKPRQFLFLHGERRFLVDGPFVQDTKVVVEMPKLESERLMESLDGELSILNSKVEN